MEYIATLTPELSADPVSALARPPARAAAAELRIDLFPELDLRACVTACPLPVLATLRSTAEGGHGPDDPRARASILRRARDAGFALIDFEFERDLPLVREIGITPEQILLSWHDPSDTPHDVQDRADSMLGHPARHIKIVTTATRISHIERVLSLYAGSKLAQERLIAFAMGSVGLPTRILGPLLGAPLSFAAWSDSAPAAPGQLSIDRHDAIAGHLENAPQRLYGVVGSDVSASLSPALHGAAYRALTRPYVLLPISVPIEDDLCELFTNQGSTIFDRVGLRPYGWAVTDPYKTAAARAASFAVPRVRRCGAANTLLLRSDRIIAENTDADGVVGSLSSASIEPEGRVALVQGTGGAARGVAVGLDLAGAEVILRGRDEGRTRDVAGEIGVGWCPPESAPDEAEILVNATPLGRQADDPSPFSSDELSRARVVVDMVYSDRQVPLTSTVAALKTEYIDGRTVLAHQGYAQFAAFTGELAPKEVMLEAVRQR